MISYVGVWKALQPRWTDVLVRHQGFFVSIYCFWSKSIEISLLCDDLSDQLHWSSAFFRILKMIFLWLRITWLSCGLPAHLWSSIECDASTMKILFNHLTIVWKIIQHISQKQVGQKMTTISFSRNDPIQQENWSGRKVKKNCSGEEGGSQKDGQQLMSKLVWPKAYTAFAYSKLSESILHAPDPPTGYC